MNSNGHPRLVKYRLYLLTTNKKLFHSMIFFVTLRHDMSLRPLATEAHLNFLPCQLANRHSAEVLIFDPRTPDNPLHQ